MYNGIVDNLGSPCNLIGMNYDRIYRFKWNMDDRVRWKREYLLKVSGLILSSG